MSRILVSLMLAAASTADAQGGDWITLQDETAARLSAAAEVGSGDNQAKNYAWGDVDQDGDTDLACARKLPFIASGPARNVLFMNEGGVLVDRTGEFASASDVMGDQGFLTPTNDRDIQFSDLNGDGWLDMITAVTKGDGQPKHISHPRVYINLGDDGQGTWLGFRYEEARIPQLEGLAPDGFPHAPRFTAVAVGDVTGDGAPDLYFVDTDLGGPETLDFNDRLLVNDGKGFFADGGEEAMTPDMLLSSAGNDCAIADMNGDGANDVVKLTTLLPPVYVAVIYNDPAHPGIFTDLDVVYAISPAYVSVGDLNNDTLPDIVVTDEGVDRLLINTGNGDDGFADFLTQVLPSDSNGFGADSVIADLDDDGLPDLVISDVDFELPGCWRVTDIYRNLGGSPLPDFSSEDAGIPPSARTGIHDVAAFDVNGDGLLDLVLGECSGTSVWIRETNFAITYPQPLPRILTPGKPQSMQVQIVHPLGKIPPDDAVTMHLSINAGEFAAIPAAAIGGGVYEVEFPALECFDHFEFYIVAQVGENTAIIDPPDAPGTTHAGVAAGASSPVASDDFEGDVSPWLVVNDASLVTGGWEAVQPIGTISSGSPAAPDEDATPGAGTIAFVTENGVPGGSASASDVDGGPTSLISPAFNLAGIEGLISWSSWFFCDEAGSPEADALLVDISNDDGQSWIAVESITASSSEWQTRLIIVNEFIEPTAAMRLRFSIMDVPNNSVTEAGVDAWRVQRLLCTTPQPDMTGDGMIDAADLSELLVQWGECANCDVLPCLGDLNGDCEIGPADLAELLAHWG